MLFVFGARGLCLIGLSLGAGLFDGSLLTVFLGASRGSNEFLIPISRGLSPVILLIRAMQDLAGVVYVFLWVLPV